MIRVWCDGSITGSHWAPKGQKHTLPHAWSGWVAKDENNVPVHHLSLDLGTSEKHSANVAEYFAVRSALWWLGTHGYARDAIMVRSDSNLVMSQLSGKFQVHNEHLKLLNRSVKDLASRFPLVSYTWIPREANKEADVLSKGLQLWDHVPTWEEVQLYLNKGLL